MAGDRILLATRKGLLTLDRRPIRWEAGIVAFPGDTLSYAMVDPRTGVHWACFDHGHWGVKLQRSKDEGATWEEVDPPAYPDGAAMGDGAPATLKYLWVLVPGPDDRPDRLYAGTEPGGLFRSDDGGDSWQLDGGLWDHPSRKEDWFGGGRDNPGIHSISIDPRDSDRVHVGISCAGVFETSDDGVSWRPRNVGVSSDFMPDPNAEVGADPHCVAVSPTNPDVIWQQNHCGIFRSTDGAESWTDVSDADGPASFGFAVAVDEKDPDVAWVVPAVDAAQRIAVDAAMCVAQTVDGGRSWRALREGLPQRDCYDITLRHCLDRCGDRIAFGTTTGNVFVSEDRGESWVTVGNHFPPVYSLRFA